MTSRRLTTAALSLVLLVTWAVWLLPLVKKCALFSGKNGVCPLRMVILMVFVSCTVIFIMSAGAALSLKLNRKLTMLITGIACLAGVSWTFLAIQRAVASGEVLQEYCNGFAETVRSRVDIARLKHYLAGVAQADNGAGGILYVSDPESPVNLIVPNSRPVIATFKDLGRSNNSVTVFWKCAGGGYGLVYGNVPPPKRVWLDHALMLDEQIWVVTRGE